MCLELVKAIKVKTEHINCTFFSLIISNLILLAIYILVFKLAGEILPHYSKTESSSSHPVCKLFKVKKRSDMDCLYAYTSAWDYFKHPIKIYRTCVHAQLHNHYL